MVQLSHPHMTIGKTIALTVLTFAGKIMSLLFNTLSRLVIAFLPRSKCLFISWLQSPSAVILEPKKMKSHCFHCFPIHLPWSVGTRCLDPNLANGNNTTLAPVSVGYCYLCFFWVVRPLALNVFLTYVYWSALMPTWWELSADLWFFFSLCVQIYFWYSSLWTLTALFSLDSSSVSSDQGEHQALPQFRLLVQWPGYSLKVVIGQLDDSCHFFLISQVSLPFIAWCPMS